MTAPVLTTERLTLRRPDARDAAAMIGFFADERSRFYAGPKNECDAWRDLAARVGHWELRGYGMFAIVERASGETVGLAGPWHPAGFAEPEMSWLLTDARHEGKGYAAEACQAVLAHVFAAHGWASLPSYIDTENAASRALALRLGARPDPASPSPLPGCDTYRHHPAHNPAHNPVPSELPA